MEGGVPEGEEPDSEPKNSHLSQQAGESHGNSESNSGRAEIPSTAAAAAGQKPQRTMAHTGSPLCILIMSWTERKTPRLCAQIHKNTD